ncbi:alpha/beta hydrolase family protein [Kitasatospora viridis]|uniref:Platelet-activating factor acetylhydrolase isoform II n=1 Tax=Kitasatospora viridis TaxID=281105 RepID=A0A561S9K2_9ACTN|nr:alpha/beta hydrolase [Kitasatospora viridis]TWF71546.1 platelet-activating factor acetylhydrolase isoform II [Kitasatospora viridis]
MNGIRRTVAAAGLLLALPLSIATSSTAFAAAPAAPAATSAATAAGTAGAHAVLPRPTGPYAVGRDVLHLVDQDRPDPWVPSAGPRQLMVSMYYPAKPDTGGPAPYMTPEAARLLLDAKLPGNSIPTDALAGVGDWSRTDARPQPGRFPLVLLSPGFTMPRASLTSLAEDLASRGYVVALVDHTYENTGTTFPDGQTLTCAICDAPPPVGLPGIETSRATDLSFVVDQLTAHPHPAWQYSRMIDEQRIGVAGQSLGGATAVPALATDARIRAGVNLDGTMFYPVPADGLGGKPFLMINHPLPGGAEDPTWTDAWAKLDGWKRWLTFAGSDHETFTDDQLLLNDFGYPNPPGNTLPAERGIQLTREYVAAFFDLQLKGIPQPLLDGPTAQNPEVAFH